jgi:hypothetical protein
MAKRKKTACVITVQDGVEYWCGLYQFECDYKTSTPDHVSCKYKLLREAICTCKPAQRAALRALKKFLD